MTPQPQRTATLRTGRTIPLNGFGTWKATDSETTTAVAEALSAGYRHIDCAPIYLNEQAVGEALGAALQAPEDSPLHIPREELFVTTKVWNTCHARADVLASARRSVADLRVGHIDLLLVHFPFAFEGGETPLPVTEDNWVRRGEDEKILFAKGASLRETWRGMEDCVREGVARDIGVSNFSVATLVELLHNCEIMPAVLQIEAHVYNARFGLRGVAEGYGVHVTMYSALGSGKEGPLQDEVVAEVAKERGVTPAQVLLAWGMTAGCSVLAKSVRAERVRENFGAGGVVLGKEDSERLDSRDRGLILCNMEEYWGFPSHL